MFVSGAPLFGAAITVATFLHGYGGFGFGYISVVFFTLLPLSLNTGVNLLTLVSFPVAIFLAILDGRRNPVDWRIVGLLGIGLLVGTPAGYWFVNTYGQTDLFRALFGLLLLLFGTYNQFLTGRSYRVRETLGPLFGLAGGFLGGAIVSGGPPMVVYAYGQAGDPRKKKGTLQVSFLVASLFRTILIGITPGAFTPAVLVSSLVVALPAVGAIALGHALSLRSSPETFKLVVNLLLLGFGLYLLVAAFLL
jgi:uncharacterized membrane protein YfcA